MHAIDIYVYIMKAEVRMLCYAVKKNFSGLMPTLKPLKLTWTVLSFAGSRPFRAIWKMAAGSGLGTTQRCRPFCLRLLHARQKGSHGPIQWYYFKFRNAIWAYTVSCFFAAVRHSLPLKSNTWTFTVLTEEMQAFQGKAWLAQDHR